MNKDGPLLDVKHWRMIDKLAKFGIYFFTRKDDNTKTLKRKVDLHLRHTQFILFLCVVYSFHLHFHATCTISNKLCSYSSNESRRSTQRRRRVVFFVYFLLRLSLSLSLSLRLLLELKNCPSHSFVPGRDASKRFLFLKKSLSSEKRRKRKVRIKNLLNLRLDPMSWTVRKTGLELACWSWPCRFRFYFIVWRWRPTSGGPRTK